MSISTKFYWSLWAVLGVVMLGLFVTGTVTWFSITLLGFISCALIFVGMMCVTISIVGPHSKEFQHPDAEPLPEKKVRKVAATVPLAAPVVPIRS